MKLNKIKYQVQFEQQIQKILDEYKITRKQFQDLSKLDEITRSKNRVWYGYQLKAKIKYLDIPGYGPVIFFKNMQELKKYLNRKCKYYLDYQQDCSNIQIQISRKLVKEVHILGSYYYNYRDNYVCAETREQQSRLFLLTEERLRDFIYQNKLQTQREKQFEIILNKNEISQFTFTQDLL